MTSPYTPQHNGLGERRNRTFPDMTKNMLKEKNRPHTLLGEAISTSPYVLNKCPINKLKEVVPIEKWTRRKEIVIHFKVFGFVCYKHIPYSTRRILDDISKVVFLICYHYTGSYKLFCPISKKVAVNRDAVVKESEIWYWSKS